MITKKVSFDNFEYFEKISSLFGKKWSMRIFSTV